MEELLKVKEDRYNKQRDILIENDGSLISLTLNIPGEIKRNDLYTEFHFEAIEILKEKLKSENLQVLYEEYISLAEGVEWLGLVNKDAVELKKMMIEIEEEREANRILDIDVFDENHNSIDRSKLGLANRKCLICKGDSKLCIRARKHTYEELIQRVNFLIENR